MLIKSEGNGEGQLGLGVLLRVHHLLFLWNYLHADKILLMFFSLSKKAKNQSFHLTFLLLI